VPKIRIQYIFALAVLVISVGLLIWSFWPAVRERRIQRIQPTQMQLPDQGGFLIPCSTITILLTDASSEAIDLTLELRC
jgi:hypothetical protein